MLQQQYGLRHDDDVKFLPTVVFCADHLQAEDLLL